MAKIVKLTEDKLYEMVEQSVLNVLTEGEFMNALNLKGIGKYAFNRLVQGKGEHKIGDTDDDYKEKQFYQKHMDYAKKYGVNDSHETYKKNTSQNQCKEDA